MRARVLVSVAVAATIALGATGCEFISPAQTKEIKQITDGVNVTTGKIDVRNALIISDGKDDDARFVGTLINNSGIGRTVTIEVGDASDTVRVPANTHVDLGANSPSDSSSAESSVQSGAETQGTSAGTSDEVVFAGADIAPGSLVKVYFSYPGAEGVSASVPVLTSAQEEYQTLAPTPTPTVTLPVETPSATPTDSATATPAG
ncbi:hypothetical protein EDF24_0128 [Curtobacterium sp. PhB130]|uniref:hypothetical protein n=1 Tax=Curtobacterium sp. PhB130 TaxID=2485178 RepID=UPI000F9986AF|nr:hypothetical protein [Curtobacterium sp. PhB130]ROS77374.1 hypothetical protein EDF24_0128 [Curtobacterium sp. PhB130]